MAINVRPTNPNVPYEGRVYPRDAVPYTGPPPTQEDVPYDGLIFPEQGKLSKPFVPDPTNMPQLVVLGTLATVASPFAGAVVSPPPVTGQTLPNGGIILPADVKLSIPLRKVIGTVTIIDGVEVTQHIRRQANIIKMDFTVRARNGAEWVFGQDFLDDLYQKIYLPSSVIYVQNTMLNKMGIQQLIVWEGDIDTIRGSCNIPITLTFRENIPGKSLII